MAESLLHDPRMHPGAQRQRCPCVSEIVESDARQRPSFDTSVECAGEPLGMQWCAIEVREQLAEVKKPRYATADEHADAVAGYLKGEPVRGWERRDDVVSRLAELETGIASLEDDLIVVSHGVLLTTWLDHDRGLADPYWFWSNLRMPDAWVVDCEDSSLERIQPAR